MGRWTANASARTEKPVYHLSVSLAPGERLERAEPEDPVHDRGDDRVGRGTAGRVGLLGHEAGGERGHHVADVRLVAGEDRPHHRAGAPPARQERSMYIEAPIGRHLQYLRG